MAPDKSEQTALGTMDISPNEPEDYLEVTIPRIEPKKSEHDEALTKIQQYVEQLLKLNEDKIGRSSEFSKFSKFFLFIKKIIISIIFYL